CGGRLRRGAGRSRRTRTCGEEGAGHDQGCGVSGACAHPSHTESISDGAVCRIGENGTSRQSIFPCRGGTKEAKLAPTDGGTTTCCFGPSPLRSSSGGASSRSG